MIALAAISAMGASYNIRITSGLILLSVEKFYVFSRERLMVIEEVPTFSLELMAGFN